MSLLLKILGVKIFQSTPNRKCYYWRNEIIWFTEKTTKNKQQ